MRLINQWDIFMAVSKICKQSDIFKTSSIKDEESLEHRHKRRGTEIPSTDIHSDNICDDILTIERTQCELLLQLDYSSSHVTHVYNPIDYASEPHCYYVRQYGNGKKQVLFIGMNPGPFGMAQNGVSLIPYMEISFEYLIRCHLVM